MCSWAHNLAHLTHFWLFGFKTWHTSHTFGSLDSKLGTPHTILALWIQNFAHLAHFWTLGFKTWHTSHTFASLDWGPMHKVWFFHSRVGGPMQKCMVFHIRVGGLGGHTCFSHAVTLAKNPCRSCIQLLCKITKCCQIVNFSKIL